MRSGEKRQDPLRIAIIEPEAAGGLAHFSFQLAGGLTECGAKVDLLAAKGHELADEPRDFEMHEVLRLWNKFETVPKGGAARRLRSIVRPIRRLRRGIRYYFEWLILTRRIIALKPDVVFFPTVRFPSVYWFARMMKRRGIRLTQVCHEFQNREKTGASLLSRWMRQRIYETFDPIFFLAESAKSEFEERFGCREATRLIPHGPQMLFKATDADARDVERYFGLERGARLVLFFGVLRPSKGVSDLVDAWPLVDAEPKPVLLVAGHPAKTFDLSGLERQIEERADGSRIVLRHEYIPNSLVGPLLSRAEVVVFPYRTAAASGALSAAQSLGRPVVVTSVGGLAECVGDGETGLVVPAGSAEELARAITRLLDDPESAERMGRQGQLIAVKERSWKMVARRVLDALEA
ncbi:glycosyltransferase family 4 protein [Silicimonas sp. MF1-12-2]|uniref:glycosyltransferase family 4 protein n=1 Tax=Silicimonas sp. MF1-12-2 TaxID=3384793 RepID=UPI0039B3CAF9